MSITEGRFEGNISFPDLQIFVDATWFQNVGSGVSSLATDGAGLVYALLGNSAVGNFFANLALFTRTGVYASSYDQEQYGTAASVAGPSSVANTSGPLGLLPGIPPLTAAQLPTLGHTQNGPIPKGTQIDSIDVIYTPLSLAASVATVGLTKTVFKNGVDPVVTNLIALGANGLATTMATKPQVFNVPVTTPAMITDADVAQYCNVNLTAGATGTVKFYGVVVHAHYNFN